MMVPCQALREKIDGRQGGASLNDLVAARSLRAEEGPDES